MQSNTQQPTDANERILTEPGALIQRMEYDADGFLIYLGYAAPGTASSSALWQVRKYTNDASGRVTLVQFAGGNSEFETAWDDRAAASYS